MLDHRGSSTVPGTSGNNGVKNRQTFKTFKMLEVGGNVKVMMNKQTMSKVK